MLRTLGLLLIVPLLACSHADRPDGPTAFKKSAEDFLQRIRWKDFVYASQMVVPERRDAFVADRRKAHDDRDLSILDYDIEQLKLEPDALSGTAEAQLSYTKLPSVSVKTDNVSVFFVFRDGKWLVDRMVGGPFEELR